MFPDTDKFYQARNRHPLCIFYGYHTSLQTPLQGKAYRLGTRIQGFIKAFSELQYSHRDSGVSG